MPRDIRCTQRVGGPTANVGDARHLVFPPQHLNVLLNMRWH
eukprot:COSAG02_NODE_53911_length_299_cov_0.745000_1_plen_40_part_10